MASGSGSTGKDAADDEWNVDLDGEESPFLKIPGGGHIDFDMSPLPPGLTVDRQGELFYDMVQEAGKAARARAPARKHHYEKPTHPSFIAAGTNSAPPFFNFMSSSPALTLYHFKGIEVKGPNYFFVQNLSLLKEFYDLEYEMTKWYNEFFFAKEMWDRKNWWLLRVGGFYAAWIPERNRWLRVWLCERVYSENKLEYKGGWYDVLVYLLDYGTPECVPRRYLLPLRHEDIRLPFVSYIGSIQGIGRGLTDSRAKTKEETDRIRAKLEGKNFSGFVLDTHELIDLPYQVLKLTIRPTDEQ